MFGKVAERVEAFRRTSRYPVLVVAIIGFAGFLLDYLWKPISTSGLILVGLAATPWLIRVIKLKKGKVAGWEFEVADVAAPASTGTRLAEELAEAVEEPVEAELPLPEPEHTPPAGQQVPPTDTQPVAAQPTQPTTDWNPSSLSSHETRVARAYLAEGLVFQELQREFGGFVQREVRIGPAEIDGIVAASSGAIAVEVKLVKDLRNLQSRISDAAYRLVSVRDAAKERYGSVSILVAIVVDNRPTQVEWSRRLREIRMMYPDLDVRVYFLPELLEKYGVTPVTYAAPS